MNRSSLVMTLERSLDFFGLTGPFLCQVKTEILLSKRLRLFFKKPSSREKRWTRHSRRNRGRQVHSDQRVGEKGDLSSVPTKDPLPIAE